MPLRLIPALLAALFAAAVWAPRPATQDALVGALPGDEFVLTLHAFDPLTASVDFEGGGHGGELSGAQIDLDRAELVYGLFEQGSLSFGLRDREQAKLIDLGPFSVPPVPAPRDVALRPAASVLSTMAFADRKVVYRAPPDKTLTLREAASITGLMPEPGVRHERPQVGHVYILRYRNVPETRDAFGRVVAFQVLAVQPGQSCTIRGKILEGSP